MAAERFYNVAQPSDAMVSEVKDPIMARVIGTFGGHPWESVEHFISNVDSQKRKSGLGSWEMGSLVIKLLTDEAAILTASMGLLPSASLSGVPQIGKKTPGLYEPIHGTAPDIAGKGIANPTGSILSTALMLRYSLGLNEEAITIEKAVEQVLSEGFRTAELNGPDIKLLSTTEFADEIVKKV